MPLLLEVAVSAAFAGTAEPIAVTVSLAEALPARRVPVRAPAPIPVAVGGSIEADGVLDETGWTAVEAVLPLYALENGHTPPEVAGRVRLLADGIALGWTGLPRDFSLRALVDPDGAAQRWVRARSDGNGNVVELCTFAGIELPVEADWSPRAAPCRPLVGTTWTRKGDSAEWWLPYAALPPATEQMRVSWSVTGPGLQGGTTQVSGGAELLPDGARLLDVPRTGAVLEVTPDSRARSWSAKLRVPARDRTETWTYAVWRRGTVIETGEVQVVAGQTAAFSLPPVVAWRGAVVATGPGGPVLRAAAVAPAPEPVPSAVLVTPVFTDFLEIGFDIPVAMPGASLSVRGPDGFEATRAVDLPAGVGSLRLHAEPGWPDIVTVALEPLLEGKVAVRGAP